jgi:hypothetical protein
MLGMWDWDSKSKLLITKSEIILFLKKYIKINRLDVVA